MKNSELRPVVVESRTCPDELRSGLRAIQQEYPHRFAARKSARRVTFLRDAPTGLTVEKKGMDAVVHYARKTDAFRALGRLLGESSQPAITRGFSETARFDLLGVMIDCSRNGV